MRTWFPRQVLEGVPDNAADKGRATIADVQEGLRRLKSAVAMQDPGKVAACPCAALAHAGCNARLVLGPFLKQRMPKTAQMLESDSRPRSEPPAQRGSLQTNQSRRC